VTWWFSVGRHSSIGVCMLVYVHCVLYSVMHHDHMCCYTCSPSYGVQVTQNVEQLTGDSSSLEIAQHRSIERI